MAAGEGGRAARGRAWCRRGSGRAGATPQPTSSSTSASRVGGAGRRHGNAASRSGRGSRPTASQSPATARQSAQGLGALDDRDREHDPGRARRRTPAARGRPPRARRRPGAGRRPAPRRRPRPRGSRADCLLGAVEVDEVEDPRPLGDELLGDPLGPVGGRTRCRPRRRASTRPATARSRRRSPGSRPSAQPPSPAEQPAVEADRQRAVAQQRVVERPLSRELRAQPPLLLLAQAEDQHLAQQVAQLVARRVRVAADLRARRWPSRTTCARRGSRSPPRR